MRTIAGLIATTLVLTTTIFGCKPTVRFASPGFVKEDVGLYIPYVDVGTRTLLSPDWQLDNYYFRGNAWKEKNGPAYEAVREMDWDGDGQISLSERRPEHIFDLRFVNRRDNGVIWVKVHPVLPADAYQRLGVIMNNYADDLSGTALYAEGGLFNLRRAKERQHTTFLVDLAPTTLAGHDAFMGTIEIAEVSKLQYEPNHRDSKVRVLFSKYVKLDKLTSEKWPRVVKDGHTWAAKTCLAVVGYYNTVDHFDDHLAEFEQFRQSITLPNSMRLEGLAEPMPAPPPQVQPTPVPPPSAPAPSSAEPAPASSGTPAPPPSAPPTPPSAPSPAPSASP